jgi:hypothetical protein
MLKIKYKYKSYISLIKYKGNSKEDNNPKILIIIPNNGAMIIFKIFLFFFFLGWIFLLALVTGETYAMENKHPQFTKWWRKHIIGILK